jgi:serine/threonine-protein kinase ULK/ATG1
MANFRLFGVGFSPPFVGKGGYSPPQAYGAFPVYPASQGSLVMVGEGAKSGAPLDEDSQAVQMIEEAATRSDVVYGFAEVKYKQLVPLAPSADAHGLGLRSVGATAADSGAGAAETEEGLTLDAILTLSEEALVLYVKVLSLLAKAMDIAGAWWARKNRGDGLAVSPTSRSADAHASSANSGSSSGGGSSANAGHRINNVVQWVRSRFNEVLEKAEFVTHKLVEAQKQLPPGHPSHPGNRPPALTAASSSSAASASAGRMGTSADGVIVGLGVTAEKLMYERALEMSRAAAVNELVGEDLAGCEIAYVTAVRMLEAVLETDDPVPAATAAVTAAAGRPSFEGRSEDDAREGVGTMQAEDRQVVEKREQFFSPLSMSLSFWPPSIL